MQKNTQADHVTEDIGYKADTLVERVAFPGIKLLHEKPAAEIADALAMVLKSRTNIVELHYRIGEFIELVLEK